MNSSKFGCWNGELYTVTRVHRIGETYATCDFLDALGETLERVKVWAHGFSQVDKATPSGSVRMDYGYALTVHKAQGYEWDHVTVVDLPPWMAAKDIDYARRWRYTAVTRAARKVAVFAALRA